MSQEYLCEKKEHWTIRKIRNIKKLLEQGGIKDSVALQMLLGILDENPMQRAPKQKQLDLENLILGGMSPIDAAMKLKVDDSTAYRARARLKSRGLLQ